MVAMNNPFNELLIRLENRKKAVERINEIVKQRFISERFGDYAKQLVLLDQSADAAETYAKIGDSDKAIGSLLEMKFGLDSVAGILMAAGKLETETMGNGLCVIKNPNFNNFEKYRELYDFAQQKYDDAVTKCSRILNGAAA